MQSRQPPSRLPPQESDIRRFENPLSEQPLHFNPLVLQSGLTPPPLSVEQPWWQTGRLMTRLYGSDDLFPDSLDAAYHPFQSVNFVTSHDGFNLWDLVSFNGKHNAANGHENADGTDDNYSWNCGWEGDGGLPASVLALRLRQARNFMVLLLLANGTPMIVARGRIPAYARREQQSLQSGQRNHLARLGSSRAEWRLLPVLPPADRPSESAPESEPKPVLARRCLLAGTARSR